MEPSNIFSNTSALGEPSKLCFSETNDSVTSISTVKFVPQPIDNKTPVIRNRVFVGNFPNSASHEDISNAFSLFGKIIETKIIDSPRCGNYAFVTFEEIASADAVLKEYFHGREFFVKGEPVKINRALFKSKHNCSGDQLFVASSAVREEITQVVAGNHPMVSMVRNETMCCRVSSGYTKPLYALSSNLKGLVAPRSISALPPTPFFLNNQFQLSADFHQTSAVWYIQDAGGSISPNLGKVLAPSPPLCPGTYTYPILEQLPLHY